MEDAVRRIVQRDKTGCGVACVAMVVGASYAIVRGVMADDRSTIYANTKDVVKALRHFGADLPRDRLVVLRGRNFRRLEYDAILKVNVRKDGHWHWVVWDAKKQRVLDPKRRPYRTIRATSYLPVNRPSG